MKAENLPPRKTPGTWNDRAAVDAVAAFHREHDRWPSAVARDAQERSLGIWLGRQRIELAKGRLDEFRKVALDAVVPGWNITAEEAWLTRARETSDFYLLHGRGPEPDSAVPGERHVALWVGLQRSMAKAGILRKDREQWLDGHCPCWRQPEPSAPAGAQR